MKMREILLSLTMALTSLAIAAQPKLHWLETVHDFGAFDEDLGVVDCQFRAVNTGTEPVTVINARANCGCTRPTYQRTPIMPGDTLTIGVAYDAIGRPGKFAKQVKIETNAATINLLLKGTVIGSPSTLATRYPVDAGNARLSNSMTPFGQTVKGRVLAAAVNIYNTSSHPIRPAVDSLPPYVNALFRPEVINPGEQGTLSLTAYTDRCPDYGVVTDRFIIIPDSEQAPDRRTRVATTVIVNEDFSKLTPEQLAEAPVVGTSTPMVEFGTIESGQGTVEREFTISNTGRKPLLIRRLFTVDPALTLKLRHDKIGAGKSAKVKIMADRSKLIPGQPLNARITLITNSPSQPVTVVRVTGEVYK